jgi:hypothetical protein
MLCFHVCKDGQKRCRSEGHPEENIRKINQKGSKIPVVLKKNVLIEEVIKKAMQYMYCIFLLIAKNL